MGPFFRPGARLSAPRAAASLALGTAIALAVVGRPLTAPLSPKTDIADMTWVEVRTAITQGYTTAIVPSGGLEQNGVHMAIGKHDHIVRFAAARIAERLGHALVTPVVSFVPEGRFDPPEGHLRFPGTLGVSEETFAGTLEGIARSLKAAGFRTICFIADHGGSLKVQGEVARRLSEAWRPEGVRVLDVSDYYAATDAQAEWLAAQGETAATIGFHAGILDTSELLAVRPEAVDLARLAGTGFRTESTGASGDPSRATPERGRALLDIRIAAAVRQIRAGAGGS